MTALAPLGAAQLAALGAYTALSVASFVLYGIDKRAAVLGSRRTPERTLHLVALFGGWPGALAAQLVFRHKTKKASFRLCFWCTVVANGALAAWLIPRLT